MPTVLRATSALPAIPQKGQRKDWVSEMSTASEIRKIAGEHRRAAMQTDCACARARQLEAAFRLEKIADDIEREETARSLAARVIQPLRSAGCAISLALPLGA